MFMKDDRSASDDEVGMPLIDGDAAANVPDKARQRLLFVKGVRCVCACFKMPLAPIMHLFIDSGEYFTPSTFRKINRSAMSFAAAPDRAYA